MVRYSKVRDDIIGDKIEVSKKDEIELNQNSERDWKSQYTGQVSNIYKDQKTVKEDS